MIATAAKSHWKNLLIVAGLLLGTLILYGRAIHFDFIVFDDPDYAYNNPHLKGGLTSANVAWAFTAFFSSNWHPVTWLSHMLDIQLFGMNAGAVHLENASIHAVSAALLFVVLFQMTAARWASAWVAAMFAWHPLHVESVAWISERKDVLSTLFMLLCMLAYVRYVCTLHRRDYWIALAMLLLGLLAKSMIVTLPCVLLLLDAWPLRRLTDARTLKSLLLEKLPMFGLIAASAVATFAAQSLGRSVAPLDWLPLRTRLANAGAAYVTYLWQALVPRKLAIFYPLAATLPGGRIPAWQIFGSVVLLVGITIFATLNRKRLPWILVGWLWYVGMLVPVIGLIQVGRQAHADRYTYVPLIGIFIAVAWCGKQFCLRWPQLRIPLAAAAIATLLAVYPLSWRQVGTWRDTFAVMRHAIDVVPNNYVAHSSLGEVYDDQGNHAAAAEEYHETLRIHPHDALAVYNLAVQASNRGDDDAAMPLYRETIWADPSYGPAYANYAYLLSQRGRTSDAVQVFRAGIKHDPQYAPCYHNLALILAQQNNLEEAIALWRRAVELDPDYANAHKSLGDALLMTGQTADGIAHLRQSLKLQPDRIDALKSLAWTLATHPSPLVQNGPEAETLAARAVELTKESDVVALDTLAAAQARQGKFDQAIATDERALEIAKRQQLPDLATKIQQHLDLYRAGHPFTSGQ